MDALYKGIEQAKLQHIAIGKEVHTSLDMGHVISAGPCLYAVIQDVCGKHTHTTLSRRFSDKRRVQSNETFVSFDLRVSEPGFSIFYINLSLTDRELRTPTFTVIHTVFSCWASFYSRPTSLVPEVAVSELESYHWSSRPHQPTGRLTASYWACHPSRWIRRKSKCLISILLIVWHWCGVRHMASNPENDTSGSLLWRHF